MKKLHFKKLISSLALAACVLLAGCSGKKVSVDIPFTDIKWGSTLEDITAAEGDDYESYDSVYEGLTYAYPKEYEGINGTVKYMFDDKDKLVSIGWACDTDTPEELQEIYDKLHTQLEKEYGESGYNAKVPTNYGDVWRFKEGNIVLGAVTTETVCTLQLSYLHPDVSTQK